MRWILLLALTTCCMAQQPEIEAGSGRREIVLHAAPGNLDVGANHQAFLVGTITDVSAEEQRKPQYTRLSESCTLWVESAYGYRDQLASIQTVVLEAGYEQSPYVPIDEDWGKLWHFKKGQRLLVALHRSQEGLCFDPEKLLVLDARSAAEFAAQSDETAALNRLVGICVALFLGTVLCVDQVRLRRSHSM